MGVDYESMEYENLALKYVDGILEVRLHTNDGPFVFSGPAHRDLPQLWEKLAWDLDVRVVIITGTGDVFCEEIDPTTFGDLGARNLWVRTHAEARRLIISQLECDVPMIAAINGPASIHAEIPLTCDIILAADDSVFQDQHLIGGGVVPGDGAHVIWPYLLGPARGRYFLMTQQRLDAQQALAMGLVNEVMPRDQLSDRAWFIARKLLALPPTSLRYTRQLNAQPMLQEFQARLQGGLYIEEASAFARMAEAGEGKPRRHEHMTRTVLD
jgi:enoyl-CoA hydratase/carnithine racemase